MFRAISAAALASTGMAVGLSEMWSSSYSYSYSSTSDGSGRVITNSSEDSSRFAEDDSGRVLMDESSHWHDGRDTELTDVEPTSIQTLDFRQGVTEVHMPADSLAEILVQCDQRELNHWQIDHKAADGLFKIELDDTESGWRQFRADQGTCKGGDATCAIVLQAGDKRGTSSLKARYGHKGHWKQVRVPVHVY